MSSPTKHTKRSLPLGWRWVKLGDICKLVGGSTPDTGTSDYWDGEIVWVTPTDLGKHPDIMITTTDRKITPSGQQSCGTEMLPIGTVIMSSRAPIGHLAIAGVSLCTNQGCKSFVPGPDVDSIFLYWTLKQSVPDIQSLGSGATFTEVSKSALQRFEIALPPLKEQRRIAAVLREQMTAVEKTRAASLARIEAVKALPVAFIRESLQKGRKSRHSLGDCLVEVKNGIGKNWAKFPVLGATREGLAPAKESVGKTPERYKLADPISVFYNPMRILLGSIAMVDEGDEPGITSPDYVVVKGREGVLDTRWFYYWFRSPDGAHLINSLSRGAVRERILFNRLSAGEIEIPDYKTQLLASSRMRQVGPVIEIISQELNSINALPAALLRRAFSGEI